MKPYIMILFFVLCVPAFSNPTHDRALALTQMINESITYESSPFEIKSPGETFLSGSGDCADMSAALIMFLESEGIKADMIVLFLVKRGLYHAVVEVDGILFDPTRGKMFAIFPEQHIVVRTLGKTTILADWTR